MSDIFVTSDWHFQHNKDFIYKARGFNSVEEMNETIIERYNSIVKPDDVVYCLGDLMLGELESGIELIKRLNGAIYVAAGNHDTDNRIELYYQCPNIMDVQFAYRLKLHKRSLFLTHYPTITANGKDFKTINIHGHTHQRTNFAFDYNNMYHAGVDSHNCYPVALEDIYTEIKNNFTT